MNTQTELDGGRLVFRRQFLLSRARLEHLPRWSCIELTDGYFLHAHPDLEVHKLTDGQRTLVLAGYLFDARKPESSTDDILRQVFANGNTFESCLLALKPFAGRYALFYREAGTFQVVHDPLGLREIYYSTAPNSVVCASQPNLLARFAHPELRLSADASVQQFRQHELRSQKWIGDGTAFAGIRHLLPNHCLDLLNLRARRYWPTRAIRPVPLQQAVESSCQFLQGMVRAAVQRQPVMLAVTAGTDSRTLLAASRPVREQVYYFINRERDLTDHSPDICVPRRMCEALGIPFHVHDVSRDVDLEFKRVFLENTFFASERILPTIYNVYYRQHANRLNLLGIGEIGRTRYGSAPRRLTPYRLAYALGYKDSGYVLDRCKEILPELQAVGRQCAVNPLTLLYWEQMLGNWGTVGNSESDIAVEEFDPYDSHSLYELFLGVEPRYTGYANNVLFKEMIRLMWPELLDWPINPPASRKAKLKWVLKKTGTYRLAKNLKYQCNYAGHLLARGTAKATN